MNDIYYEILMHSDINTIQHFNWTHKQHILNQKFWIDKFFKDNLNIIHTQKTVSGWIHEYMAVQQSVIKKDKLLKHLYKIKEEHLFYSNIHYISCLFYLKHVYPNYDSIPFLPKKMIKKIIKNDHNYTPQSISIIFDEMDYYVDYIECKLDQTYTFTYEISKADMHQLLLLIYYDIYTKNRIIKIEIS